MMTLVAKMGRKSKGERSQLVMRVPRVLGDRIRRESIDEGISITDYITRILARELDMPECMPPPPKPNVQLPLPIDRRMSA